MARAVAIAVIAMLAICLVAEVNAQGKPFCRTSAYKLSGGVVGDNKKKMFGNCGADVKVVSQKMVGDCAVIVQQVKNKAAWEAYSECEKSGKNSALYKPLKEASSACSAQQKSGDC